MGSTGIHANPGLGVVFIRMKKSQKRVDWMGGWGESRVLFGHAGLRGPFNPERMGHRWLGFRATAQGADRNVGALLAPRWQ